jgi:hypothetical protein
MTTFRHSINKVAGALMLAGAVFATNASRADAAALVPGGDVAVPIVGAVGVNPFANVLVVSSGPLSDSSLTGDLDATFWAAVYRDTVTGFLDFYYQVRNDTSSTTIAHRETEFNFGGFTTDVYATVGGFGIFGVGVEAPTDADRSGGTGATVGFEFQTQPPPGSGTLNPGELSYVKIIRTNATEYTTGVSNLINGGVAEVATFAPTVIPEPATLLLVGLGLAAGRKRLRNAFR